MVVIICGGDCSCHSGYGIKYRSESTCCANCDIEPVDLLPAEDSSEIKPDKVQLVELASLPNASGAGMILEALESNGMSTVV